MVNSDLRPVAFDSYAACRIVPFVADRRIYLREWREKKGLTQGQVIDRLVALEDPLLPQTGASLSRLENGKQPYSERILEALADIYDCEPWELIGRHPGKEGEVVFMFDRVFRDLTEAQKRQALAIIEALKANG